MSWLCKNSLVISGLSRRYRYADYQGWWVHLPADGPDEAKRADEEGNVLKFVPAPPAKPLREPDGYGSCLARAGALAELCRCLPYEEEARELLAWAPVDEDSPRWLLSKAFASAWFVHREGGRRYALRGLLRADSFYADDLDPDALSDEQLAAEFTAFLPDRVDSRTLADKLFEQMTQVILDLGSTESCIIEGRLSDYILRHNPNHIAVLVTAPFDERVKIVAGKRGLNRQQGARLVKRMQRFREDFYKRYSAGKWRMDSGKDLVVNRAKLGREGCMEVIAAAYRAKLRELGVCEEAASKAAAEAEAARPLRVPATVE